MSKKPTKAQRTKTEMDERREHQQASAAGMRYVVYRGGKRTLVSQAEYKDA